MAKKPASKRGKKALKAKDLAPRGESAKVKGGAVGPCNRKQL
jgi:hypothetical protein